MDKSLAHSDTPVPADITNWDNFAEELAKLSTQFGIGLEGATAYRMEGDDFLFAYQVDDEGKLTRT